MKKTLLLCLALLLPVNIHSKDRDLFGFVSSLFFGMCIVMSVDIAFKSIRMVEEQETIRIRMVEEQETKRLEIQRDIWRLQEHNSDRKKLNASAKQ